MIDVDLIKNSARQRKISLADLAGRIDYSEAGFHKALTNGTLRVEAIIRIAKILDLSLESFVKDEKILKLTKALSNNDDQAELSNDDQVIKHYVERIRALHEGLNAYHQQMDVKDEQLRVKDIQLMKCMETLEVKDRLIEELVRQNMDKDKAFKEVITEMMEYRKNGN